MKARDGSWRWIQARGNIVARDVDRSPIRVAGTHLDVTEYKEITKALAEAAPAASKPMNGIIGISELLLEMTRDERQRGYAEMIRSCEYLRFGAAGCCTPRSGVTEAPPGRGLAASCCTAGIGRSEVPTRISPALQLNRMESNTSNWRKPVGVEPTSDARRRSTVLKTAPTTGRDWLPELRRSSPSPSRRCSSHAARSPRAGSRRAAQTASVVPARASSEP